MSSAASLAEAARWGRVEGDGHVFLTVDGEEHPVGQYPGVSDDEALGYFARKYDDVVAQIVLLEQRVSSKAPTTDMQKTVTHLREQLAERNMVGDLRSAEARLDTLWPRRSPSSKRPRRPNTTPSAPPNWPPARRSSPRPRRSRATTPPRSSGRPPAPG